MNEKPPKKPKRHKLTNACDISPATKREVNERDNGICVICRKRRGKPECHYISRAQLGLGIKENIVTACEQCHHDYDNGDKREEYGVIIEEYLKSKYPDWDRSKLFYTKYADVDPNWLF
ncbi:MAG: hypothetical protein LLG05_18870 [Porphyromonadaceae bacterium]|nr:hypothetical protein [Porphyromonadaceae bacterium]